MSLGALTDAQIAALCAQVPVLAAEPRTVTDLSGGLTNRNLRVTNPLGDFVARCTGSNSEALGIDRDAEHHNTVAAAEAGVGAPVHDYRPDLGILVIGYLPGRTLGRVDVADESMLPRVASAVRQLHAGPAFVNTFDMFERQASYLATVRRNGHRVPVGYEALGARAPEIRRALAVLHEGLVPCNNDLLPENFVESDGRIRIIDYEYSGNNDACFELGNIAAEAHLTPEQLELLVTSYYGRPRPDRVARARLLGAVGAWGWTLWGAIQAAVSPLEYDFWQWALDRMELAREQFTGGDLDRLLTAVASPAPDAGPTPAEAP